jgi:hypothetical protein
VFGVVDDHTHTVVRHHRVGNALAIRAKTQSASPEPRIGFRGFLIHDEKTLTLLLYTIGDALAIRAKAQHAAEDGLIRFALLPVNDDDLFLLGMCAVGDALAVRADDEERRY